MKERVKTKWNRLLSILLCSVMLIGMIPMKAHAADTPIDALALTVTGYGKDSAITDATVTTDTVGVTVTSVKFRNRNKNNNWQYVTSGNFEVNKAYSVEITLNVDSGYDATGLTKNNVSVTGGGTVSTYKYESGTIKVYLTFNVLRDSSVPYIKSIEVTKQPNKTTYVQGEYFDYDGMEVTGTFSNTTTAVLSESDWSIHEFFSSSELKTVGDQKISVRCHNGEKLLDATPFYVTVNKRTKVDSPNLTIDYVNERLVGLVQNNDAQEYLINGNAVTERWTTSLPLVRYIEIQPTWIGTTVNAYADRINHATYGQLEISDPQSLPIPRRPAAPALSEFSIANASDGASDGGIKAISNSSSYQYRKQGTDAWIELTDAGITSCSQGDVYQVRKKATTDAFASLVADITIGSANLIFTDSDSYDIPEGAAGEEITPINLASGAVTGGTTPYSFSKEMVLAGFRLTLARDKSPVCVLAQIRLQPVQLSRLQIAQCPRSRRL